MLSIVRVLRGTSRPVARVETIGPAERRLQNKHSLRSGGPSKAVHVTSLAGERSYRSVFNLCISPAITSMPPRALLTVAMAALQRAVVADALLSEEYRTLVRVLEIQVRKGSRTQSFRAVPLCPESRPRLRTRECGCAFASPARLRHSALCGLEKATCAVALGLCFGFLADKAPATRLPPLRPCSDRWLSCSQEQPLPHRRLPGDAGTAAAAAALSSCEAFFCDMVCCSGIPSQWMRLDDPRYALHEQKHIERGGARLKPIVALLHSSAVPRARCGPRVLGPPLLCAARRRCPFWRCCRCCACERRSCGAAGSLLAPLLLRQPPSQASFPLLLRCFRMARDACVALALSSAAAAAPEAARMLPLLRAPSHPLPGLRRAAVTPAPSSACRWRRRGGASNNSGGADARPWDLGPDASRTLDALWRLRGAHSAGRWRALLAPAWPCCLRVVRRAGSCSLPAAHDHQQRQADAEAPLPRRRTPPSPGCRRASCWATSPGGACCCCWRPWRLCCPSGCRARPLRGL